MFVVYKETSQILKYPKIRTNIKVSSLLSITSLSIFAAQHCRCDSYSSSPPYSVLIFSAADILFRLIEAFVGQVEEVQKNCFHKIMSTRQSNQENSSIFESNRSRRQQPTPSNIPSNQQQEPLNSSPSHSDQASKACCFCWCCCCSCSCLTVRTDEGRQPVEPIDIGEPPSIDELRSWSESFDKLMMSPAGRHYFREFLRSEYSEENFLFWMSCESLKNEQNPDIIEEKARLIYEDYISILSPKEVSLDSRVREVINRNMVEPSPHTFDEAQLQIYTLMHRDSYPRFINSQMYRRLIRSEDTKS
ncbi:hypothetical protein I4U23_002002 [Adineta vaga]|nr:hypothetical protein I4U23_002002 [Adineta vaga]